MIERLNANNNAETHAEEQVVTSCNKTSKVRKKIEGDNDEYDRESERKNTI